MNLYTNIRMTAELIEVLKKDYAAINEFLLEAIRKGNQRDIEYYEMWLRDIADDIQYQEEELTELVREVETE